MFWTKVFEMGYGESMLLSYKDECLLIDCGSESKHKEEYIEYVKLETLAYNKRQAMISHFHEDHINGFMKIASEHPHAFEKVYIPHIFTMEHPNLTDMELIKYFLERKYFRGSRIVTLWDLLELLCKNFQRIKLLQRRERAFDWGEDYFDVLWPIPENLVHPKLADSVKACINIQVMQRVYGLSEQINNSFIMLEEVHGDYPQNNVETIIQSIERAAEDFARLEFTSTVKNQHMRLLKSISQNANKASIVFQNHVPEKQQIKCDYSILLTGDVPNTIMKKIAEGTLTPEINLNSEYNIIKAPHHGTDTHYFNFGAYALFDNLVISNGETNMRNRGRISRNYNILRRDYNIVCTNSKKNRCESCCAKLPVNCSPSYNPCGCKISKV